MNVKTQLKELLDNTDSEILETFFHGDATQYPEYRNEEQDEFWATLDSQEFAVEFIDSFGGEGMGDEYWTVYKFTKNNESFLVKFNGWYQSYNGAEYTDWFFVQPKQVMVTKYYAE